MDLSAGSLSLFFEAHQKVKYFFGPVPPVHDITGLDEMRLSPDPMEIVVDQADLRVLEDQDEVIVIPVEVANNDDLFYPGPYAGDLGSVRKGGEGEKEKTHGKVTFRFFAGSKHRFEEISFLRHVLLSLMILESLPFFTQNPIARYRYYQGVRLAYFIERFASRPSWDPLPPGPHGRSCCRDDAHPEAPKCRIESTSLSAPTNWIWSPPLTQLS